MQSPKIKPIKTLLVSLAALLLIPAAGYASESAQLATGQHLYESACIACHGTGAAGAPELGDKAAWAPYIAAGMENMVTVALHGKGSMPARGGTEASEADLRAAVEYIVSLSK